MKKLSKLLCLIMALCLGTVGLFACGSGETTAKAEDYTYVSMRINPEIELVIDEDGIVVAVNAINEDGEEVLCSLELTGKTVEEAAEAFTAMATELGFIDVDSEDNVVYIHVDGEKPEEIQEKISEKVNGFFDKKGIYGKAFKEEFDEELKALAEELQIELKDAKIVQRVIELYPEMTLEEIMALSFKERLDLIKDEVKNHGFTEKIREEYKGAVELLKEEYSELFELQETLRDLMEQLKNPSLTEEEITSINQQIEDVKAQVKTMMEEYKADIEELKEEKVQQVEEAKEEIKQAFEQRRDEHKQKLQEHEEKFNQYKEEIEQQIKDWREKFDRP